MIHPDLGFRRFASVSWLCFYLLMKVEPPLCTSPWWGEESHLPGLLISNNNCSDSNNSNRAPIFWGFLFLSTYYVLGASLIAKSIKTLPALQETGVRFLGQEDPLEKEMQPTPVFLPGKSHGQRSLVGYSPWGCKELE